MTSLSIRYTKDPGLWTLVSTARSLIVVLENTCVKDLLLSPVEMMITHHNNLVVKYLLEFAEIIN